MLAMPATPVTFQSQRSNDSENSLRQNNHHRLLSKETLDWTVTANVLD